MIISNHKTLYKNVAEKESFDLALVEAIGQFTWADLNERIATFANREIYMLKLGTFKFRKLKGENYLKSLKKSIAIVNNNPLYSEENKEEYLSNISKKIESMEKCVKEWDEIIKEKKEFKDEQNNRHIQQSETDLGRTEKQNL